MKGDHTANGLKCKFATKPDNRHGGPDPPCKETMMAQRLAYPVSAALTVLGLVAAAFGGGYGLWLMLGPRWFFVTEAVAAVVLALWWAWRQQD
jgi:hypothetical protein